MKSNAEQSAVLKRHFDKLKKQNRLFSIRSLALKVGVSHSFLSRVFAGKSKASGRLLDKLISALKIDHIDAALLKPVNAVSSLARAETLKYQTFPESHLRVMRKWWNLALLDLLTCDLSTDLTIGNLHLFLPIPEDQIQSSVDELRSLGLLKVEKGVLKKAVQRLRIPARGPNDYTKAFYEQTLTLAKEELGRTNRERFESRTIVGFTCAVNRQKLPEVRQKLVAALRDVVATLSEGRCDDVYLVQAQMFSVLK